MISEYVEYNATFDESARDAIQELMENPILYRDRIFSVSPINVDAVILGERDYDAFNKPSWHLCVLKEVSIDGDSAYRFIPLFDSSYTGILKNIQLIELNMVNEFTLYPDVLLGDGFLDNPYVSDRVHRGDLSARVVNDFISRKNQKNGDISVLIDSKKYFLSVCSNERYCFIKQ